MKRLILRAVVISSFVMVTLLSGCNGPEPQPADPHRVESIDPDAPDRDWR